MKRIDRLVEKWEREGESLQADLRDIILAFAATLKTRGGYLEYSQENMVAVAELDNIIDDFDQEYLFPFVAGIYIEVTNLEQELRAYYRSLGLQVRRIPQLDVFNEQMSAYFSGISANQTIALEIKEYLMGSVSTRKSFKAFVDGIREQMGKGDAPGKLTRYLRTYLWDAVMKFYRTNANAYADDMGLNYFWYRGGLIETSRQFCIKKNDKLFHRKDALHYWPSDPDLPGDPLDYTPLVDLGRWNCRHYLEWITDEMAEKHLKDKKK